MVLIDRSKCVKCGLCVRECIVQTLHFGTDGVPFMPPDEEKFCLKCQHCLAVCPREAVVCEGKTAADCARPGPLPRPEEMANLLRARRSCRHYREDAVAPEKLAALKQGLAWSPTGCNDHQMIFTVVDDPEDMEFFRTTTVKVLRFLIRSGLMRLFYPNYKRYLGDILAGKDMVFRGAPHLIAASSPRSAPCGNWDPWIALSYFDLHAQSLGLGTCWCGFAVYLFRFVPALRRRLNLPRGYKPGAVMLFGEPAVTYPRMTCPDPMEIRRPAQR